jgi:Cu2+-exporting ATPase
MEHHEHHGMPDASVDAQETASVPPAAHAGHHGEGGHAGGHDRHEGHSVAMFREKFWLSLALTIPVVILSPDIQHWFGYSLPTFPVSSTPPPSSGRSSSSTAAWSSSGRPGELADRKPGMMTLISLAIIVAFVTSWAGTLGCSRSRSGGSLPP